LKKILDHYSYLVDDMVVENVFITSMENFIKASALSGVLAIPNNFLHAPGLRFPRLALLDN